MSNTIEMWSLTTSDLERDYNCVKDAVLRRLASDEIISKEQYEHFSKKYVVILRKPSLLTRLWRRITGKEGNMILVLHVPDDTIKNIDEIQNAAAEPESEAKES